MLIPTHQIDQSALKVNQAFLITFLLLAFLLRSVWMVALLAVMMLLGTAVSQLSLPNAIYQYVLIPARLIKPRYIAEDPKPHYFAQGFCSVLVALAALAFWLDLALIGWILAAVVITLAALSLFGNLDVGCFLYHQLSRLGFPGFTQTPCNCNR